MTSPTRLPGHRFLHSPGPSRVPDEVLHAMSRQPMDLADPRVDATIAACEAGLKRLLHTEHDVFLYAANGHGAWEAVIANLVAPGTKVLIAGTGHFSESWAQQTEAMGGVVIRTPWVEGLPIAPADIEAALRDDAEHEIAAVFVVHTDTASGITSDLAAIRAAIDRAGHPALYVVDVVASLGAAPFDMTALRANVALGACQKGLMVPPGLAFVAVDDVAMDASRAQPRAALLLGLAAAPEPAVVPQVLRHAAAEPAGRARSVAAADRARRRGGRARPPPPPRRRGARRGRALERGRRAELLRPGARRRARSR